ncbi:hypothetical protein HAX54_043670, partial [Datura stramonium]|nr:hypothetical protein [Datura stramonium]
MHHGSCAHQCGEPIVNQFKRRTKQQAKALPFQILHEYVICGVACPFVPPIDVTIRPGL